MDTFEGMGTSGKSGSLFFTTPDKKYLVKTTSKEEFNLFIRILKHYFNHLCSKSHSLIAKIYSLHRIVLKSNRGKIEEWIILFMQNILCTSAAIHEKYDFKGSTYKRKTKGGATGDTPGKDLDFKDSKKVFNLGATAYRPVINRLTKNTEFLASQNIIDYSLLVGVHNRNAKQESAIGIKQVSRSPSRLKSLSRFGSMTSQVSIMAGLFENAGNKKFYMVQTVDSKYAL